MCHVVCAVVTPHQLHEDVLTFVFWCGLRDINDRIMMSLPKSVTPVDENDLKLLVTVLCKIVMDTTIRNLQAC
jgi:hypothetical protein